MGHTVPPSLMALGRQSPPDRIEVQGRAFTRHKIFKNDFFAVTALYVGESGRVILKLQRQASFLLVPLGWLGRLLTARECAALQHLGNVPGVPELLGRWGATGLVRRYIDGHPLVRGERVPDDFHARLRALIHTIHDHGMAYVDLEKSENVLVGDDGRPYLFDFQISWYLARRWGGELWPARKVRQWLQVGDLYHLGKLQRRTRPDQLTAKQRAATYRKPWHVHAYRFVTWPFTWCRRRVLGKVDSRRRNGERGRVVNDKMIGAV